MENVKFSTVLHNMALEENQILDYDFKASRLKEDDIVQYWSSTGKNYSVAGFEIRLQRHALQNHSIRSARPPAIGAAESGCCEHKQ